MGGGAGAPAWFLNLSFVSAKGIDFHLREPSNANETISVGGYAKDRVTNLTSNEVFVAATQAKESQRALRWRRSLPKNGYVRSVRLHQVVNVTSGSTCFDLALIGGEDTTETQPETCLIMASIPIIERVLKAV